MSKCKRPTLPAFCLQTIHETNLVTEEVPVRCASQAEQMSAILPHLWLGSWRDAEDAELMRREGITHVLNVAKECPSASEQASMDAIRGVTKKQIDLADAHSEDILPHFEAAFAFMEEARHSGGKVLVHCRRGISRSPAIVTGYLMFQTHCSYEAALNYVKARRLSVSLNLAFRTVLEDYQPGSPHPDAEIHRILCGEDKMIRTRSGSAKSLCSTEGATAEPASDDSGKEGPDVSPPTPEHGSQPLGKNVQSF
jgi:protein-tyrosine phosphatase